VAPLGGPQVPQDLRRFASRHQPFCGEECVLLSLTAGISSISSLEARGRDRSSHAEKFEAQSGHAGLASIQTDLHFQALALARSALDSAMGNHVLGLSFAICFNLIFADEQSPRSCVSVGEVRRSIETETSSVREGSPIPGCLPLPQRPASYDKCEERS